MTLSPGGNGETGYMHFGSTVAATTVNKFGTNNNDFVLVGAYGHADDGKTNSGYLQTSFCVFVMKYIIVNACFYSESDWFMSTPRHTQLTQDSHLLWR